VRDLVATGALARLAALLTDTEPPVRAAAFQCLLQVRCS
jgi:hypothetical protein